jgi:methylated-DNA-protein-cysteine methyltransferase related protein
VNEFSHKVIAILRQIPYGQVSTYGTVALLAGSPGGARQVARLLHSSSEKYNLPWHRVVNREGKIPPRPSMSHLDQQTLLKHEGVEVSKNGVVDLEVYLWCN